MDPKEYIIRARKYKLLNRPVEAKSLYEDAIGFLEELIEQSDRPEYYEEKLKPIKGELADLRKELYQSNSSSKVISISKGQTNCSFQNIFGQYFREPGIHEIHIEEPYIKMQHQMDNLINFVEVIKNECKDLKTIRLYTIDQDELEQLESNRTQTGQQQQRRPFQQKQQLKKLAENLERINVNFTYHLRKRKDIHDRWIILNNGLKFLMGKGLDIYQKKDSFVGKHDYDLRECIECSIIAIRSKKFTPAAMVDDLLE